MSHDYDDLIEDVDDLIDRLANSAVELAKMEARYVQAHRDGESARKALHAAEEALREIAEMDNSGYESVAAAHFGNAQRIAHAALACPPQGA